MDIFSEARNLAQRYEKGDAFRRHVEARLALVLPVLLLFVACSIALGLGVVALMGTSALRTFLGVLLMPLILIGSLFLQIYVFFSWIELRALEPMLAHHSAGGRHTWLTKLRSRLGKPPAVPWVPTVLFLLVPFVLLVLASLKIASLVLAAAILLPLVYAHLDR